MTIFTIIGTKIRAYKNREYNGLLSLTIVLTAPKTIKKLQGNPSKRAIKLSPKSPCERIRNILPIKYRNESISPTFDFGNFIYDLLVPLTIKKLLCSGGSAVTVGSTAIPVFHFHSATDSFLT